MIKRIKNKGKVKVAFFVFMESMWKYDELYHIMEQDNRFETLIVICPHYKGSMQLTMQKMDRAYDYFSSKGYNVIKTYDKNSKTFLDVKKVVKPDIVFFTIPGYITNKEYLIENFADILTVYVSYSYRNSYKNEADYNRPNFQLLWRYFQETQVHKELATIHSFNRGKNCYVTGFPGLDKFFQHETKAPDVFKFKDKNLKKIIWAPHHSLPGMGSQLNFATFLKFANIMTEVVKNYEKYIQIIFKPHPMLWEKLSRNHVWGKEKTEEYYQFWDTIPNGQLWEGEYTDLFLSSDGMIHDCASFITEYLCVNKPVMYIMNDDHISDRLNKVGKIAFQSHYHATSKKDIETFIEDVIIGENDYKKEERTCVKNSVLKPPNNKTASQNIYQHIVINVFNE